jgi:hypothetical protein
MDASDTRVISSETLSPTEREAFEQAFLSRRGTVLYEGQRYSVTAMDQNYASGDEDSILVSFTLKPLHAPSDRHER